MSNVRVIWDPEKAESNRFKHGISFEDASQVFLDPLHMTRQDRIEGGKYRWQTIGQIYGVTVILVAHTWIERNEPEEVEVIRIISARKATAAERKRYESEIC